jgi:hypothetical protein
MAMNPATLPCVRPVHVGCHLIEQCVDVARVERRIHPSEPAARSTAGTLEKPRGGVETGALTPRADLIGTGSVRPEHLLAITFTNRLRTSSARGRASSFGCAGPS